MASSLEYGKGEHGPWWPRGLVLCLDASAHCFSAPNSEDLTARADRLRVLKPRAAKRTGRGEGTLMWMKHVLEHAKLLVQTGNDLLGVSV